MQGPPDLTYVDNSGSTLAVPVVHGTAEGVVLLQPGQAVVFHLSHANGYAGWDPGAPECAHPATYSNVKVVLPGGSVSLRSDGTITVLCGSITVNSWVRPGP